MIEKKKNSKIRPPHITGDVFFKYVTCPAWVYWDIYGNPKDRKEISDFQKKIMQEGLLHEEEVIKEKDFTEVKIDDLDEAAEITLQLMKKGRNIYHGVLIDGNWTGIPDFLEAVKGESDLGNYYYVPYDIKSSKKLEDAHKFQLTFYAFLLEKIQGIRPEYGHIINADKEVLSFPIEEFVEKFELTLEEIERLISGAKPAPFLTGSCKQSPWFESCKKEARICDDISLIYKITKKEWKKLKDMGIATVSDLVKSDLRELKKKTAGISIGRLETIKIQAEALQAEKPVIINRPKFSKNEKEIYFDIEGDPLRRLEYLFGLLVVSSGKEEYVPILAKKPEDEEKTWKEFVKFIENSGEVPIYHYGSYERQVITRLGNRYGISDLARRRLDERMVDLMKLCGKVVIFPVLFYSLKDIAKYLGFKWRNKKASGMQSIIWYDQWINNADKQSLKDVIEYNEDDVRATKHLKDWLENIKT